MNLTGENDAERLPENNVSPGCSFSFFESVERRNRMYHSITIGEKNTWDDWHLIPTSRPLFNPPTVKTHLVDIPGGDGVLNLTNALAGRPTYNNRTGSWTFAVQNGFMDWATLFSEIMAYLHGQTFRAILEDDPAYYYEGLFLVNQWKSDKDYSQIVIEYNVDPYKWKISNDGADWLWDTFNFETGVIRDYSDLQVAESLDVIITNDMMVNIPTILCSESGMQVIYEGKTYALESGANVIPQINLRKGDNTLQFLGQGIVTIESAGGTL